MGKRDEDKHHLSRIAAELGMPEISPTWTGVDAILPLLERMRQDGAIVLIKWDGERGPGDTGPYTVVASGAPLKSDSIRIDAHTLEDAIAYVVHRYAVKCWGFQP